MVDRRITEQARRRSPLAARRDASGEIEAAVIGQVRGVLSESEIVVATWRAAKTQHADMTEPRSGPIGGGRGTGIQLALPPG